LETRWARLELAPTSVTGSGPTGATVTLQFAVSFIRKSAGHAYRVDLGASDDLGHHDPFTKARSVHVQCRDRRSPGIAPSRAALISVPFQQISDPNQERQPL